MPQLTNKGIWKVTYPVLISLMMQHLIGVIDTIFLGRLGEVELGAAGLGGVYYLALFMLGFGFSIGAQIIIARRNGERSYDRIGPVFMQSAFFLLGLAVVSFALVKGASPYVLAKAIQSPDVYDAVMEYVDWRIYGYFFAFVSLAFRAFYVGTTRTGILTVNALIMVAANSLLNYLLIFGHCGFPAMGIAGAALASALAELVSIVFLFLYTMFRTNWQQYRLFCLSGASWRMLFDILKTSVWTMMQSFVSMSIWFVFFMAVEHLGEHELAISNVVRNVSAMLFMFVAAFSTTTNSLVSNVIGAGNERYVMPLTRRLLTMCYLAQLPFIVLVMAWPSMILRIFTDDAQLIANSVPSMVVMASSYLLHAPALVYLSAVTGTGNTRRAMWIEMVTLSVYLLSVVVLIMHLRIDITWCWLTEHIDALGLFVLSYWFMKKGRWRDKII